MTAGIQTALSFCKEPDPAIVVEKQKKYKYEEKERAVISPAGVFTI